MPVYTSIPICSIVHQSTMHACVLCMQGIVVCMPIYYATGSRWKGFVWSTISGVSEIMGAVVVSNAHAYGLRT